MADKKISQLSSASTPLAGTEVLPIVQSGSTVKVASDDLTVKNVRSNATSGILQVAGPAAAATRTMTVPDANFTAARTDAGQTFSGTQSFSTINTSAGYQFRGADNTSYETLRYVGGTNNPGLFTSVVEASKKVRLNATGSIAAGHELCLGAEGTQDVLRVGVSNVTLSTGNLVVGTAGKGITGSATNGDIIVQPDGTGTVVIGSGNAGKQERVRTQKHTFYATKSITTDTVFLEIDFGATVGAAIVDIVASGTAPGNDNIRLCARYFCDKNSVGTVTATALDTQGNTTMLSAAASGTKVQFTAEYIASSGTQVNFYGIEVLCVGGQSAETTVSVALV